MDLLKSGLKIFSARAGGAALTFIGLMYFSRAVPAADLGVFFLFQAIISFSSIPANLGTRLAVEKRISEGTDTARYFTTGIVMKVFLLLVVSVVMLAGRSHIESYLGSDLAIPLIIAIALKEFADLMIAVIRGELRVGDTAVLDISYQVGWIGVGSVLVAFGYGLQGLVIGVITGYLLKFCWGLYRCRTGLGLPGWTYARSLAAYGFYSIIPSVEGEFHNWMDVFLISVFMGPAAVAAYEIAWRVANVFIVLIKSIGETIFPQMSAWDADGSTERLETLIPRAISPALVIIIPATAGSWLLGSELLDILFGAEYTMAAAALVVLIAGKFPRAIQAVVGKGLLGIGRADRLTYAAVIDMIANLALNIVLIQAFGLVGAALGTTLSLTIGTVVRWWYLSQFVRVSVEWPIVSWAVGSTIVMSAVLSVVLGLLPITGPITLLGTVGFGAAVYFIVLSINEDIRAWAHQFARSAFG